MFKFFRSEDAIFNFSFFRSEDALFLIFNILGLRMRSLLLVFASSACGQVSFVQNISYFISIFAIGWIAKYIDGIQSANQSVDQQDK